MRLIFLIIGVFIADAIAPGHIIPAGDDETADFMFNFIIILAGYAIIFDLLAARKPKP